MTHDSIWDLAIISSFDSEYFCVHGLEEFSKPVLLSVQTWAARLLDKNPGVTVGAHGWRFSVAEHEVTNGRGPGQPS